MPGYYFKEQTMAADDSKPRLWLIYLGGGDYCWDKTSCLAISETGDDRTSPKNWAETMTLSGIFDDNTNNLLSKANKVYAPPCSADAWQGGAGGFDRDLKLWDWGYYYRGNPNFYAIMEDLVQTKGLGQHPAGENIVFGGHRSGARGALTVLDHVNSAIEKV